MSDPTAPVLARAKALVDDLALGAVRAWKEENPGGLAVGYLPVWVPRPLLEAQGCLPVGLFGGGEEVEIVRGDSFFQSYICHIPRSAVELALRGSLDPCDAFLFPSTCDVIRNLGGVFHLLFPGKPVAYLDLPHNERPEIGGAFFAAEMEGIAATLAAHGARPLDDAALLDAIVEENARRRAIAELDRLRREEPWRVPASEAYLVVRAGAVLPARAHTALVTEYVAAARERAGRPYDNVRVIVCGSFCEQPPLGLIRALEKAGCYVVDDDFQLGMRLLEGEIEVQPPERPLAALARAFLEIGAATATRWGAEASKGDALVHRVRRAEADGVLFAAASFCDPALLDRPLLEAALERAGIPYTSFKFAENTGQLQPIREQAGAFSDAVKLWGEAG
jgi:benzoyl-CoA reductase subunit C